jgi:AAA+ superfamily predicted ATPase
MATRPPRDDKKTRPEPTLAAYPAQPLAAPPGYATSIAHLMDHLRRIDQRVKAQVIRWRNTIAATKPENLWGMIHVTDGEVQAFLNAPICAPGEYPPEAQAAMEALWTNAAKIASEINALERNTRPGSGLRLLRLQEMFQLSELDRDILLTCLLPEWDPRYRRLYGYLQDDASRTQPTVELVASILNQQGNGLPDIRPRLDASAPLLARGLLLMSDRGEQPLAVRSLRVDDRITSFLWDSDTTDARLRDVVAESAAMDWAHLIAEPEYVERLRHLAEWWQRADQSAGAAIFLRGAYGSGRLASARALATAAGSPLLRMDVGSAARASSPWAETVHLAFREALLRRAALYFPNCETLLARDQSAGRWEDLIAAAERFPGIVLFGSEMAWEPAGHFRRKPFLRVELPSPGYALRRRLWEMHLPPENEFASPAPAAASLTEGLANRFQLSEGQILDAIAAARSHAVCRDPREPLVTAVDLYEGCRRQASRRLLTFARRVEPRSELSFADLVLPETNLRQLREVQHRIRTMHRVYSELGFEHRLRLGRGMVILFTGSSGTGKTMAAEWLARELGVDLYRADLSALVSKWVGETEKNLHQLFAEAEDSSAIIFFDEADALFGKRGEVKDARDRWANNEVNYLLQRIEEYAGVVILASNLRQNIDEAFLRRISAMVEFPAPDEAARVLIWRGMFPPGLGRPSDEEIQSLAARVKLPGGSVRNIVLDATFRAVKDSADKPLVTLRHLVLATGREYQKLGRPITRSELGEAFFKWIEEEIL